MRLKPYAQTPEAPTPIRPSRAPSAPPQRIDRPDEVALALAQRAKEQLAAGERDDARRTVGDAVLVLDELVNDATIARVSVMLGEVLLALDAPQHAHPRFARAADIYSRTVDRQGQVRARIGLGRSLVALDDYVGCEVLLATRAMCQDPAQLAEIEAALRAAGGGEVLRHAAHGEDGVRAPRQRAPAVALILK